MPRAFAELAFTPRVRAEQERHGSAASYGKFLAGDVRQGDRLGQNEADFLRARDGFYQATVSSSGWPYVQFRGGAPGFLKVLDEHTLAYADFRGNRQYLSVGNLRDNDRIALIAIDYANSRRLKLWGRVRLVEADEDPALMAQLHDPDYPAEAERAFVIHVEAVDWNCRQHIPERLSAEEWGARHGALQDELHLLRVENARLQARLNERVSTA